MGRRRRRRRRRRKGSKINKKRRRRKRKKRRRGGEEERRRVNTLEGLEEGSWRGREGVVRERKAQKLLNYLKLSKCFHPKEE